MRDCLILHGSAHALCKGLASDVAFCAYDRQE